MCVYSFLLTFPLFTIVTGVDVLFKRMNLRFCYFFPDVLSAAALKASLAEVCTCMDEPIYVCMCVLV